MKKYLIFIINYCFFISSLLFLPKIISLNMIILLIAILTLDNIYFSFLPLILCLYLPTTYIYIIVVVYLYHLILYPFIKKCRLYSLSVYLLSNLTSFLILFILKEFDITYLKIILFNLIIFGIINIFYKFEKINNKYEIIPYQKKLIDLTLLLNYFLVIYFNSNNKYLIYFLFMQLFLIKDLKYNILFTIIYTILEITNNNLLTDILISSSISYMPLTVLLTFKYKNILWIVGLLYTITITIISFFDKKITIEDNYINNLFDDFNKYIDKLGDEYNKNIKIKTLKENKYKEICNNYCNNCYKNTVCKKDLRQRYAFISSAMLGYQNNIYKCSYYNNFDLNLNIDNINKSYEYSAIKSLSLELSYLYNQSLFYKKEYEKFLFLLSNYNYTIENLDINLASSSLYFSITLKNNNRVIESLLLKCAYKAFGEELELKQINNKIYFYKKPLIKISYAHTILAKDGNIMSGDNYYIKKDYNNSYTFVLSDGMGSGYNAYTESIDALKTIISLSSYHFRTQTILKLLEDIYELRSNYDRYATLDFLSINSATRKINLYKMGSTTTYIYHNERLLIYENKTLPLKLDEVNSAFELDIYSGDFIFLLSDGISDFITSNEFESLINTNLSAEDTCYNIVEYLKKKENGKLKDDISLIVIKVI